MMARKVDEVKDTDGGFLSVGKADEVGNLKESLELCDGTMWKMELCLLDTSIGTMWNMKRHTFQQNCFIFKVIPFFIPTCLFNPEKHALIFMNPPWKFPLSSNKSQMTRFCKMTVKSSTRKEGERKFSGKV